MAALTTRPPRLGAALAATALALTGCSADVLLGGPAEEPVAEADTSGLTRGPVPDSPAAVSEEDLPDTPPAEDAPRAESIGQTALDAVTSVARVVDPDAEVGCVDAGEDQLSVDCTVTYEGVDFDYSYAERPDGSVINHLLSAPLLRSVVEDDLRIDEDTEYVDCDMDDLEVVRGELSGPTPPFRCEYLDTDTQEIEAVDARVRGDGTLSFSPR